MKRRARLPVTLFLSAVVVVPLSADSITLGATGAGNRFPFGRDVTDNFAAGDTYQQIYRSAAFPGPVVIRAIGFMTDTPFSTSGIASYDLDIRLSTTTASPSDPSQLLANNRGSDFTTVFSGPLTVTISNRAAFELVFPLAPFLYDPRGGNLLVDVFLNKATRFSGNWLYFAGGFSDDVGRQWGRDNVGQINGSRGGYGLLTEFSTASPVPEPSSMFLFGSGAVAIWRIRQRFAGSISTSSRRAAAPPRSR
jgi:hypothetical protein